jgi:hypothetical protein
MISLFSFLYRWYAETFPAAFEVSSDVGADLPLKFNQQKPLLSAQMKTPRTSRGRLLETTFSAFSLSLERCRFFCASSSALASRSVTAGDDPMKEQLKMVQTIQVSFASCQ